LRLVHVISEGITVGEAGRKFLALILDYGFYTGTTRELEPPKVWTCSTSKQSE
jgi:hypothetical protein